MEFYTMPTYNPDKTRLNYDLRLRTSLGHANKILSDLAHLQLLHLIPYREEDTGQRRRYNNSSYNSQRLAEARDLIVATLRGMSHAVPRKMLSDALKAQNFSEASTGPICNQLQRDGVIISPKRGYWQMKPRRVRARS